jgi:predicted dehydrogenase
MASEGVDAAIVASPSALHAGQAAELLALGIPTLVEKPPAISREQAAALREARAAAPGVPMMAGFNGRFFSPYAEIRRRLRSGEAGELHSLRLRFLINGAAPAWKRERAQGGGAPLDLGIHLVDLARWITGREVVAASARLDSSRTEHGDATIVLELEGGVPALLSVSLHAPLVQDVEVTGTEAVLSADRYGGVAVEKRPKWGLSAVDHARIGLSGLRRVGALRERSRAIGHDPAHERLLARFLRAARAGNTGDGDPTVDDGLAACDAILLAEENPLHR